MRTVMQQLIEWKDAATAWRRWVRDYGLEIEGSGGLRLPPSFSEIRGDAGRALHGYGISQQRVGLIRELARLGERIPRWADESVVDLRRRLLSIPRLGVWTVDHFLGFSLNEPDAVPLGDFQLPHTVSWALEKSPRATTSICLSFSNRGRVVAGTYYGFFLRRTSKVPGVVPD